MIARVTPESRAQFINAVRGRPYFGSVLPVELEIFGGVRGGPVPRFFTASPGAALCLRGRSALLCGTYDREETGGFLALCGADRVRTDGAPPPGYAREERLLCMALLCVASAEAPPMPRLAGLSLDTAPPPGETADFVMRGQGAEMRDNFYSELCTKLARGAACVWAARRDGRMIATAGAYALSPETAYLAAIETAEALRGRGIGSWLTGALAACLAAKGRRVSLLCGQARAAFYERLGFAQESAVWQCARAAEPMPGGEGPPAVEKDF